MDSLDFLKKILKNEKIGCVGALPISSCKTVRPYKLDKLGFSNIDSLYIFIFAVPYLCRTEKSNISAYAAGKDYHLYFKELFERILPIMKNEYPGYKFYGFSDSSPIAEVDAAAKAGIGIIGENGMLITEKYSSFVFIGEIITDMEVSTPPTVKAKSCISCGACRRNCPITHGCPVCLSELTQTKGELDKELANEIIKYNSAWGCDICQMCCPYTLKAIKNGTIYSPIDFFNNDIIAQLNTEIIENMSDGDFKARAYSWRGKNVILRNLRILEKSGGKL